MDAERFDALTRTLAIGASRRALKLLTGVLGGALAGRRASAATHACSRLGRSCDDARPL